MRVLRLDGAAIVAGDLDRLARFYAALGFAVGPVRPMPEHAGLARAAAARGRTMRIGGQTVELVSFDPPGGAYPTPARSTDPWFQHVALVAPDIAAAMARLGAAEGWTPISRSGVVRLPAEDGGVSAFKFRDPEGHPLEFLAFPAGAAPPAWDGGGPDLLGYDHSAVGVSDVGRSVRFYEGELGLAPGPRTLNRGAAQEALDDVAGATVDVVAMLPDAATPHVELLGYHGRTSAAAVAAVTVGPRDLAATRLVLAASGLPSARLLRDPDGHWLHLVPA